jgi:hypothetical protein
MLLIALVGSLQKSWAGAGRCAMRRRLAPSMQLLLLLLLGVHAAAAVQREISPAAGVRSNDDALCDSGSLTGASSVCTITKIHTLDASTTPPAPIVFEGNMVIQGAGGIASSDCDDPTKCTLTIKGTGKSSRLIMKDTGSVLGSYVDIEAPAVTLWNSSWINATAQPDYEINTTCTLQLHATMPTMRAVTIALYNRSRITGARVNISAIGSLWVGSDAPSPKGSVGARYAAIDASAKVFSDPPGISPAPNSAGGGYAGVGGNCDAGNEDGGKAYGPIFGDDKACLDGSPGGAGMASSLAGPGGGQILIHAHSIILDGTITVDGAPGQMIGNTLGSGGGSGGCVNLQLSSSDDDSAQEPPIHSSPDAEAGQWCGVGPACMVSANGGSGYSGGSGGRIMMNATMASLLIQPVTANHMSAVGGINLCQPGDDKSATQAGAAGTKFLNLRGDSAILAIDGAEQGLGARTPVNGGVHWMGLRPHQISAIYARYNAQVLVDRAFTKQLRLRTMQLIGSEVSWTDDKSTDASDAIDLQAHDISLNGASQLSGSPLRISCNTLSLVERAAQIISNAESGQVSINATDSMDIGGHIHSSAGVNLACKGRRCKIHVGQDGAVATAAYGFLNLTAEHIEVDGHLTGGAVSDSNAHYPVTCSDQTAGNKTVNIFLGTNRLNVVGTIVGGSILVCPRHANTVVNSVTIQGKLYTKGSGPGQNSGPGKGTAPQTGGHAAGGAGHGGLGGRGIWQDSTNPNVTENANGGTIYDVNATAAHLPDHVGSGGGGSDGGGGAGGGIVAIRARDLILRSSDTHPASTGYSPNIDVRGADALVRTSGGGGSGGTVVISTRYLHGDGIIDARGGKGGSAPPPDAHAGAGLTSSVTTAGSSFGGGGGGGVVWFDWQGGDAAAAARSFVNAGPGVQAGKVLLDGGRGGHTQHGTAAAVVPGVEASDGTAPKPVLPFQPINHNGARGELTAPNCPAGYDGCLCRACPPGRYKSNVSKHIASTCSSSGPSMVQLCDLCTNAPTRLRDGSNVSDAVYTMFGQTNATCPYSCRPGTIGEKCLDPWDYCLDRTLLWLCVVFIPLLLLSAVRMVLQFVLEADEDAALTRTSTGSIDSSYSSLSADGHMSFSEIRNRRTSNVGVTLAESMRNKLGWDGSQTQLPTLSPDTTSDDSGGWTASAGSVSTSDDGKLKAADLPYLHSRLYLQGENSPGQPWALPKDPPETLVDLVDVDKYFELVQLVSEMLQWSTSDKIIYGLLFVICHPLASSFHRSVREKKLAILSAYIVSAALPTLEGQPPRINRLDDIFLQTERDDVGRAAERVKLGHSGDATMAYLDIVIYNQRSLSSSERAKPLLPKMILFEGRGQWFSPFHLNIQDALVRSVVKMAPRNFASELNETIAKLGPDAIVLDTSLVDVLAVLDRSHKSRESSVQFELRLLTVGGDRRLGLLARMKTWRENSSDQLSGDVSEELRLQRYSGSVITEDDLREMPLPARLQFLAVALLGLRASFRQPKADALLGARLAMGCMIGLDFFFSLVAATAAVLVPQAGYGIGESYYPVVALFFSPGAALTVIIAPLAGCVDLVFPELNLTRQQTMWNLASMLAVTMLAIYIELDSNTYLPREKQPAFVWKHDYNYSLYACILLFLIKCLRNACATLLRAAWDRSLLEREAIRQGGKGATAGGPPILQYASGSQVPPLLGADSPTPEVLLLQQQQREFQAQQQRISMSASPPSGDSRPMSSASSKGSSNGPPKLESFGTLTEGRASPLLGAALNASLPAAGEAVPGDDGRALSRRGRSESLRDDRFGSMTGER